jgi:hypothetical protein
MVDRGAADRPSDSSGSGQPGTERLRLISWLALSVALAQLVCVAVGWRSDTAAPVLLYVGGGLGIIFALLIAFRHPCLSDGSSNRGPSCRGTCCTRQWSSYVSLVLRLDRRADSRIYTAEALQGVGLGATGAWFGAVVRRARSANRIFDVGRGASLGS